jgi:hypothetical protein
MKNMRTYTSVGEYRRLVRKVTLVETYKGSAHWYLFVHPEGYGSNPEPLVFRAQPTDSYEGAELKEGYGIFRIEYAVGFAKALTGAEDYDENTEARPQATRDLRTIVKPNLDTPL